VNRREGGLEGWLGIRLAASCVVEGRDRRTGELPGEFCVFSSLRRLASRFDLGHDFAANR
jgi:hypothetical protein